MPFQPRRELGTTGFNVTSIASGDVADPTLPIEQCVKILRRALDAGINLVDTAPNYENGLSETIVGRAVQGRRDDVFIIDKIDHFDRPVAPQIEASLERLDVEYVDAFVFHAVNRVEDLQRLMNGAFEELDRCIETGKVRFRGISSHHPDVLRVAIERGLCDIVMFPVGPYVDRRYIEETLPLARKHGAGQVCFKTFGGGKLVGDTEGYGKPLKSGVNLPRLSVEECVHYSLTVDPDVVLLGMSNEAEQDAAFAAAEKFAPLSPETMRDIERRALRAREGKGPCWWNPEPDA